ncbi:MAG TPA: efflux RND transporter permease subunit, partial [Alphaproteobacteria bacterium]|nr:efflux RND transporter permease subunit [Alphaproteobacteria bacterium]
MTFSAVFIRRPVATTLLTLGVALAGAVAFFKLPVSPLPQVDFPTITVRAQLPGASPEVMATSVATPLERHLGQIADVSEMSSSSSVGSVRITLQFGLDRDIDGAARDVQAAINAARADLPASLRSNPTYRKVNPADAPILILSLTSGTLSRGQIYDAATNVLEQRLSQVEGIGQVTISGSSLPAVRVELNPTALFKYGIGLESVRAALAAANAHAPKGAIEQGDRRFQIYTNDQATKAADYQSLIVAYRNGAPVRLSDVAEVTDSVENLRNLGLTNGKPSVLVILNREPGANIIDTVDRVRALLPELRASMPNDIDIDGAARDVQAAINAARADLPDTLRSNPTYRKYNPADAPIMILALTSKTLTPGQLYDSAATVLGQKLSQVEGIGNVDIGGSSLPAVRVELNPRALFQYGIGLEDVRAALASANAHAPKGAIEQGDRRFQIYTNDQATKA